MARWIKIDVETPHKRQISSIMNECGVTRGEAFLAFFTFFAWVDELTADGKIYLTDREIDRRVNLDHFTTAMMDCGWLQPIPGGFLIVNYEEHNGANAKRRALAAKRQNEFKDRKRAAGERVRSLPPVRR